MSEQGQAKETLDSSIEIQNSLKQLLQKILNYMEKFIKTPEDLEKVQGKLKDYESMISLIDIIKQVFDHLTEKMDTFLTKSTVFNGSGVNPDEYDQLEKILQKHQAEIRNHISLEQQLKLYSESIQSQLDDSQQTRSELLDSTKQMISDMKRENQQLAEQNSQMKDELENQNKKMKTIEEENQQILEKCQAIPFLNEKITALEQQMHDARHVNMNYSKELLFRSDIKQRSQNSISGPSPMKVEKRAPSPNMNIVGFKKQYQNSYERFSTQVQPPKEDYAQLMGSNPQDLRTIYSNTNSKNGFKEKDMKTINSGGVSITNSHNNSFVMTSSSSQGLKPGHKRSKSHQLNQMKGMVGSTQFPTDFSRLSNQDYSDFQGASTAVGNDQSSTGHPHKW